MSPLITTVLIYTSRQPYYNILVRASFQSSPFPTAWITGRAAEYMETLGEEEVGWACQTMMSHFLQAQVPAPSKVIR